MLHWARGNTSLITRIGNEFGFLLRGATRGFRLAPSFSTDFFAVKLLGTVDVPHHVLSQNEQRG